MHLHGSLGMFSEQIGWPPPEDPLLRVGTFMEDTSIERADGLLAASRSIAELTRARLELDPGRIDVVAGAVDSEFFAPAAAAASERPRAAAAVRRQPRRQQGHRDGARGVHPPLRRAPGAHVDDRRQRRRGGRRRACARGLRAAGVAERVELLGFVEHEDLPALYRSADVFAAPSRFEGGLGLVYLEAMACGLPVVATAAGGAAEAIEDGVTGLLLERGEVEETTAAIGTLLGDPALRAAMGAAGRERVRAHFTQDALRDEREQRLRARDRARGAARAGHETA